MEDNKPQTNEAPMPDQQPAAISSSVPTPPAGMQMSGGSNLNGPMPDELKGWNWGAFFFTWIWGIAHNVWLSLLVFVPVVGLFMRFVLGFKGNEWAWENRRFESVEHFKQVQKVWTTYGIVFFVITLVCMFMLFSAIFSALSGRKNSFNSFNETHGSPYVENMDVNILSQ